MNQMSVLCTSVQQHKPVFNAASKSNLHVSGAMRVSGEIYSKTEMNILIDKRSST